MFCDVTYYHELLFNSEPRINKPQCLFNFCYHPLTEQNMDINFTMFYLRNLRGKFYRSMVDFILKINLPYLLPHVKSDRFHFVQMKKWYHDG